MTIVALRAGTLVPALAAACLSASAQAQVAAPPAAPASAPEATLPAVPVRAAAEREDPTGPTSGYRGTRSQSASKTDTPLVETPASVTVVTRELMVDQGANTLQDALNYAAGVRSDAYGLDSRTDSARVRGSYPDEYLDGLRKNFDWYTSNARTEPFTLERIEVLRGPAAMLYGQGSTGGVLNMVSKRPQAEVQGEVGLQLGSWNRRQLQADLTGPLSADGQWLYRLVAVARKADTQVDHLRDDRTVLAPALTWRPGPATSLTLQGLVQNDRSGSTSQFFPWAGMITPTPDGILPTNRFVGEPGWDRYDTDRRSFGWLLEHRFDSGWTLRQNLRWSRNEVDYRTLYGDSFTTPGGWHGDPVNQRLFGRFAEATLTEARLLALDQHVQGRLETGALRHELLAGLDVARYRKSGSAGFDAPVYAPYDGGVPLIDAWNPVYGSFTPPAMSPMASSTSRQVGLYLQDQVRLGGPWLLTAGLRHDRVRNETEGVATAEPSATTKRIGVLYRRPDGWAPYLSYSESFTPVANIGGQPVEPLRGKQWELGVKFESSDGRTGFSAAAYDLRELNRIADDPVNNTVIQLPHTQTGGLELEFMAVRAAGELVASYTSTDVDAPIEEVPAHQASVWGKWRFALAGVGGFSAGAGVRYLSAFHDGAAPTVPALTLLDAVFAWEQAHWRAALNVNNLTDKVYVATCLARGDCWWGARRNVVASLAYRW